MRRGTRHKDNANYGSAAALVATVGGLGRVPWAPGTCGSVIGVLAGWSVVRGVDPTQWTALLMVSIIAGALICTKAERALRRHDPPAVILDEVIGMATVLLLWPALTWFASRLVIAFALFRLFDIVKPPPLKWLARWPSGWGIMADDLGAAIYVVLVLRFAAWLTH